jgi:hypothetical protein
VEVRLLRNGSELEHSTVRNVVTHLEFLPEAGILQARAHPLSLGRHSETFQVECPHFGQIMLDQAQKTGARVVQQARANELVIPAPKAGAGRPGTGRRSAQHVSEPLLFYTRQEERCSPRHDVDFRSAANTDC